MTAVFVKLCPDYADSVGMDGTLIIAILKGLYGLIVSGHTWFTHLTSFLSSIGFVVCKHDQCVLKMGDINLVIYVDDLLLTGPEDDINNVLDSIENEFGDRKRKSGPELKFIGMEFIMKDDGISVMIDLKNLLENTQGTVETPCGSNVLSITSNAKVLVPENKEKFHSTVAKLLYIAKRKPPEFLFVVNFLCTRVQEPTVEDAIKLGRVMKYLNGCKEDELFLKIMRVDETIVMEAHIDAAYGCTMIRNPTVELS